MYENREISSAPSLVEEGRSAKAINQTADTNVREKSDCAVVPVNQPNNEGGETFCGGWGEKECSWRRTSFRRTCS